MQAFVQHSRPLTVPNANVGAGCTEANFGVSTSRANGVDAQLDILEGALKLLSGRVSQLRDQLGPVLDSREASPQPPGVEAVPTCSIANRIAASRREVAALANFVDDVIRDLAI